MTRRTRQLSTLALAILALSLGACSSMSSRQFDGAQPRFEPDKFFLGTVHSWGVVENRTGDPRTRFQVVLSGRQEAGGVAISQHFAYEDGRTEERHWIVRRLDDHHYEATSPSIAGVARGEAWGNVFRWDYTLIVSPGNPFSHVHMSHWMYLVGPDTMVNRVRVSKLGITVAQITEYFQRGDGALPSISGP